MIDPALPKGDAKDNYNDETGFRAQPLAFSRWQSYRKIGYYTKEQGGGGLVRLNDLALLEGSPNADPGSTANSEGR